MDPILASRLDALFKRTLTSSTPIAVSQKERFIEAICAQSDRVACISEILRYDNGLASLRAALRYDSSALFVNNHAVKILDYLRAPEIEELSSGQYLQKILMALVTPPIFWETVCSAYKNRQLSGDGEICFSWLVYKLVSFQIGDADIFRSSVREKGYVDSFIRSTHAETKGYGERIQHILDTGKVVCVSDNGSSPGGRHDNDFLDFRKIAIMPTVDEILSTKKPFLRTSYMFDDPNTEEDRISIYLDNQFRLLREDMLNEIREEVQVAQGKTKRKYRPQIYRGLVIFDIYCGTDKKRTNWGIRFKLTEDIPIFRSRKIRPTDREDFLKKKRRILSHQSPVCLIVDEEIVAVALVDRDEEMLARIPPVVCLQFDGESTVIRALSKLKSGKLIKLQSIDVAVFSYEPILKAIQRINEVPLYQELLFWTPSTPMPPSQNVPPSIVTMVKLNPCQELQPLLRTPKSIKLDPSQAESFLNCLTQRVSLIQGPPGTGKSFIGALLAKTIHDYTEHNILLVCYTNHALDQFLEDLMDIGIPKAHIVRVGGIGKATPRTTPLALQNQRLMHRFTATDRHVIEEIKSEINTKQQLLEDMFKKYLAKSATLQDNEDILDWLEFEQPDYFDAFQIPKLANRMSLVDPRGRRIREDYLLHRWSNGWGPGPQFMYKGESSPQIWSMGPRACQALLAQWRGEIIKEQLTTFFSHAKLYNELIHQLERKFSERDTHTLQNRRIIGCTTTGAAKYTELLQSISPSVLLVEEAGEILESHILTALGGEKNQMILIGDHKQLRPKVSSYPLTVEKGDGFDLNKSLFERLVLQGYPHTTLSQQHRMRPEISALVRTLTYPDLVDAPTTSGRPNLVGVCDNVVLIDHDKPEDETSELADRAEGAKSSKQNAHEVEMVFRIVRYLIQQGYKADKMVVLTPYLGQLQKLNARLKSLKETDPVLGDMDAQELARAGLLDFDSKAGKRQLRLSTIDNYQGEESDIVIISLTRSNSNHDIGFMQSAERVNVMLSRARDALIMIGNVETFHHARKGVETWRPLLDNLRKGGHIYDGFPVKCERHLTKIGLLRSPDDFDIETPDGGCKEPCGAPLNCGIHICPRRCHFDNDHSKYPCRGVIYGKCSNGHDVSHLCHKGPTSFCLSCEKETKRVEEQKRVDIERKAKEENDKAQHESRMAEIERQIQVERQKIRNAQLKTEREHALLQKESDLCDTKEMVAKALRQKQNLTAVAGNDLNSSSGVSLPVVSSPLVSQNATPTQPPASNAPAAPLLTPQPISSNQPQPPSQLPSNKSSSLPDEWKLKSSPSETEWKRQKELEGARNDAIDAMMKMTGLESIKEQLLRIKSKIDTAQRQNASVKAERFNIVFLGNPGTGKTTVARHYAKFLANVGILPGNTFVETTGSRLLNQGVSEAEKLLDGVLKAGGGAIFIDEAYQLTGEQNMGGGGMVLDFLLAEMENNTDKLVFILAGYAKQMEKFFEHNPGLQSRVPYRLVFIDYDQRELLQMLGKLIEKTWEGKMNAEGGLTGLHSRIAITRLARGRGTNGFGNARALQNMFSGIRERQASRLENERRQGTRPNDFLMTAEDIIGPPPDKAMNESRAWKNLQEMIGLGSVKKTIQEFFILVETNYLRELEEKPIVQFSLNRCFLGPPGTGKTTVAQLYGEILKDLGLLSHGEVVVKNPSDFIGSHLGHSERNTKGILESTKGKVLVIDEAYMLYSGPTSGGNQSDAFKAAVIDTIVAEVQSTASDDRCVLLLGYEEQMKDMFQNVNPGLSRRFDIERAFRFENFNDSELLQILELKMRHQGLKATDAAKTAAISLLSRARNRPNFGNGGEVDNVLARAKARSQQRLGAVADIRLEAPDFDPDHDRSERASTNLEKLFADVVGCEEVIQKLRDYQNIARTMAARGMDRNKIPMNFIFKGPPGTGKTTTARKMGQVFYDMGFLAVPEVVECSASDLVGQYVGQTGPKTKKIFEKALGKVLFIDEAYRLAEGHFAQESMDEIVALLTNENFMGKMLVILAGYDQDINRLMNVNTGLSSRFPETINFHNLSVDKCLQLLEKELAKDKIIFPALRNVTCQTYDSLSQLVTALSGLSSWGNGRDIKTLAGQMVQEAFKKSDAANAQVELTIADEDALRCASTMLQERFDRERNVNHRQSYSLPTASDSKTQQPPPPITTSSTAAEPAPPPASESPPTSAKPKQPPSQPKQKGPKKSKKKSKHDSGRGLQHGSHSNDSRAMSEPGASDHAQRDPGVTDEIWLELQAAKRKAEQLLRSARDSEAALERNIEGAKRKEGQLAARKRVLEVQQKRARNEADRERLRKEYEKQKTKELAARRAREQAERRLRERKKQEEERKQREAQIQQKLRSMGVCVAGYEWKLIGGGYRCAGGSHFISNAQLGI